ncbi:MAG: PAS domain S-box protein, partial [Mariprofundaceae bacterium]
MTEKTITDLQDRLQRMELENQRLHQSLDQTERLDQKFTDSLARLKTSKNELKASEALLKGVLDSAIDCIIGMDQQGRIIGFNQAAEKMFAYKCKEVLGKELSEAIIPPALREKHQQGLEQWLKNGADNWLNKRIETIGMRSDGSEFPVELSIITVKQSDTLLFTGFIRDLTGVKVAEETLHKHMADEEETRQAMLFMLEDLNESRANIEQAKIEWEQTFDAVTDPIFSYDENFHIVRANRAYAECAGMRIQDVIGKPYWQVFPKRDDPLPGCLHESGETEEEIRGENGEIFLSRSYSMPGEDETKNTVHFMEN